MALALAPAGGTGTSSQKKPAAAVASAATNGGGQSWALLDPTIDILDDEDPHHQDHPAAADSSAAVCTTSDGRSKVRVWLRLAEPPASSYVQLHTDADVHVKPALLAADGGMLLMRMAVARVGDDDPTLTWYEDNYLVYDYNYKARPEKEQLLHRLPQQQLPTDHDGSVGHVGIACSSGTGDWVVAGFRTRVVFGGGHAGAGADDDEVGVLSRLRSSSKSKEWDTKLDLRIPFNSKNRMKGLYKFVWHTDDVVALNRLMFWIDYHRGMIYCDVFEDFPELHYMPLPGIHVWGQDHDYSKGRQLPQAYRTVGVSRGQLKFINIDHGLFGAQKTSGFKITTWSLKTKMINKMKMKMTDFEWVEGDVLQVDDLWDDDFWKLPDFLPRSVPEYPVVDKKDTSILHFILRGPQSDAKAWIITIDMRSKELKSYKAFTNELNQLVSEDASEDTRHIFCDSPLISCDFDHLTEPTGSRADTVEVKYETTLLSISKRKKRKPPSPAEDNLELSDTPDSNITTDRSYLRMKLIRRSKSAAWPWLEDPSGTCLKSSLHRHVTKTRMSEPQEVSTQSQGNPSQRRRRRLKTLSRIWGLVRPDALTATEEPEDTVAVARPATDEASPSRPAPHRSSSRATRPSGKYAGPDWQ